MKNIVFASGLSCIVLLLSGCGAEDTPSETHPTNPTTGTPYTDTSPHPASKAVATQQTNCPVMGGTVNRNIYVDYRGKRIYFCCQQCVAAFRENPERYLEKLNAQGVIPEKAPASPAR